MSEWWVMLGEDPDRPLDGPFDDLATAMEFARENYEIGDARLIRLSVNGNREVVASTNPHDFRMN